MDGPILIRHLPLNSIHPMNVARQIAKGLLAAVLPRERILMRGPRSMGRAPRIALTFDDGPHPIHTPLLLDQLAQYQLRATFFVIGENARRYSSLVARMHAEGHEIGNHTWSHTEPKLTSATMLADEVRRTDDLLFQLTGEVPVVMRPPKGEVGIQKLLQLWRLKKTVAMWNVDPKDFRMKNRDEMDRWCRTYQPADGDILLMHDNHPYANSAIENFVADDVFDQFETVTLSNWLNLKNSRNPVEVGVADAE